MNVTNSIKRNLVAKSDVQQQKRLANGGDDAADGTMDNRMPICLWPSKSVINIGVEDQCK